MHLVQSNPKYYRQIPRTVEQVVLDNLPAAAAAYLAFLVRMNRRQLVTADELNYARGKRWNYVAFVSEVGTKLASLAAHPTLGYKALHTAQILTRITGDNRIEQRVSANLYAPRRGLRFSVLVSTVN